MLSSQAGPHPGERGLVGEELQELEGTDNQALELALTSEGSSSCPWA